MGSGSFALPVLEGLLHGYPVAAVYTQPDRPAGRGRSVAPAGVKRLAAGRGVPVFQPVSLKSPAEVERLRRLQPEVIVVAAYGQILRREVLDLPPLGCVNVHPSLLPRHRGPSPVVAALLAGDRVTGVTLMLLEEGVDTGPILAQQEEPILPDDTAGTLTLRLARLGARLLDATLPAWAAGELKPRPQDHARATCSRLITKEDGKLDWNLPAADLERRVRAFDPWPGAYTAWRGRLLKVLAASPLSGKIAEDPGRVVPLDEAASGTPAGVQTGEGVLRLLRVQAEGKRPMTASEFIRGQRDFIGSLLS